MNLGRVARLSYNRIHYVQYKSIMTNNTDLFIPSFQSYYNSIDKKKQKLLDYMLCATIHCPYEFLESVLEQVDDRATRYRLMHDFKGEENINYVIPGHFDTSDSLLLDNIFESDPVELAVRLSVWLEMNPIFNNPNGQKAYGRYNAQSARDRFILTVIRCGFT